MTRIRVLASFPLLVVGCDPTPDTAANETASPATPASLAARVDEARYQALLEDLAQPRDPGSSGWQAAQDRCALDLETAGFTVDRQAYGTGTNVIGMLAGEGGPTVVLSAHYDSVPDCPGADDNASGVAGALEAARVLGSASFARDLVIACWDEEERGLVGSEAWVEATVAAGTEVGLAFVFEMIGYKSDDPGTQDLPDGLDVVFPDAAEQVVTNGSRADFVALLADEHATSATGAFEAQADTLGLPFLTLVLADAQTTNDFFGELRRSDHDPFWQAGLPAVMVTDSSEYRYSAYHCRDGDDTVDRLDDGFAAAIVASTVAAVATVAKVK